MTIGSGPISAAPIAASAAAGVVYQEAEIIDALVFGHRLPGNDIDELVEILTLSGDPTVASVITVLNEVLTLTGTAIPDAKMTALVTELLSFQDSNRSVLEAAVADVLALTGSADGTYLAYATIVDTLVATGVADTTVAALGLVTEVLALRSALLSVHDGSISDALAFAEAIESRLSAYELLVSSAVFADDSVGIATVTVLVDDDFVLSATVDPRVSLAAALVDGLDFSVGFVFDDVPYLGLSMTAATKALTSYTNFAFDSMASFNGQVYAAGDGGLYRLGGDDDAGTDIVWRIRTGLSNLGTGRNKGLDAAYIGHTATGRLALKCIVVDATGTKRAYWYELTPSGGSAHSGRILTGRGLRSVYWGFELTNVEAGDIELDVLELHPVVFEGRVP